MDIERIPRHVDKDLLPGLKIGDIVQTKRANYSQPKNSFVTKHLPAWSVGRVKRIYDFGRKASGPTRFLTYVKFHGHALVAFYSEELSKVRV